MNNGKSLKHYGVLGMKWGVRRNRGVQKSRKTTSPANESDDFKKTKTLRKKKPSEMSNTELKELNTRLQLEKQYKDLTKAEISTGRKWVEDVLANAAKQTMSAYLVKYAGKSIEVAIKKATK